MRRSPVTARRLVAHRLPVLATVATVLFTTVATAASLGFATAVTGAAVRRSLAASPRSAILVTAQVSAAGAGQAGAEVARMISGAASGLPIRFTGSLRSQYLNLPGRQHAQTQIISLPGLARHAALVSGRWPGAAAGRSGAVPVSLTTAAARILDLAPGDTATLHDSVTRLPVRIEVTGVFRITRPASWYWQLDPLGGAATATAAGFRIDGPLVTSPAAAAGGGVPVVSGAWLGAPDFAGLRAANLATVGQQIGAADGQLANSASLGGPVVSTGLPAELGVLATALVVARSQLLVGLLILLVITGAALAVAVRLLTDQREGEAALLMARGSSRRQLAVRGVTEAVLLVLPAAVAGPLTGTALVPLLARAGPFAAAGLRLPAGLVPAVWLSAEAVAAGCAIMIALPWLRQPPSPVRQRAGRGRQAAVAGVIWAGADLGLVALALLAGWQLAHYSAPVSTGLTGTIGVDPILVSAPVLALAAGTVVMLRLLPLAARLADAAAGRGRGITLPVAAWQIGRRPLRLAAPALLAVLAVATAVIALTDLTSWQRSVTDQSAFTVGAATRITVPAAAPLGIGQAARLAAARSAAAGTPVARIPITLPQGSGTLLALDGRAAAAVVKLRADLATTPPAVLLRRLGRAVPVTGAPVPGRPARLRVAARLSRAPIDSPVLTIQLTDSAGVYYQVPAGPLPADGRTHLLTVTLAAGHRTVGPLRLDGFGLDYLMPPAATSLATLTIESVTAAPGMTGPAGQFGRPFPIEPPHHQALLSHAAFEGTTEANGNLSVIAPPKVTFTQPEGRRLVTTFQTGSGQNPEVPGLLPAGLTVTAGPAVTGLPAIATRSLLADAGQHLGGTISVTVNGAAVRLTPVAVVRQFPTLTSGLVVDQAGLQDALRDAGAAPAPVTEWWAAGGAPLALSGLPAGMTVTTSAAVARSLRAQPLSSAGLQVLLAIALAALILAGAGFVASVATGREREHDAALLDALGAARGDTARLLCLEQAMLAVPAAAAGLLLGALLSYLIIPAVSITAQATHPVPPVIVAVPWPLALLAAAAITGGPALVAALVALRPTATAARLRVEEEM